MIVTQCTKCSREIRAENQYAGRIARCPGCSHPVEIPKLESQAVGVSAPQATAKVSETTEPARNGLRRKRRNRRASSSRGMNWEVRRIRVLHAGLFGLVMGGLLGGLCLVFGMLAMLFGGGSSVAGGMVGMLVMTIAFAVMAGIQGMVGAVLYNIVASMTGGYKVQLHTSV